MARQNYEFTSESVSEGHPDKVCDRISDEIVDLFFREGAKAGLDPYQIRVACETLATTNRVVIAGEVRGPKISNEEIEATARKAIKDIGYEQDGFHWRNAKVEVLLHAQSADIAQGVDAGGNKDEGAGDQGIMFGYACRETPELMPAPLYYAHEILRAISKARHSGAEKTLGPDAKSQVTVRYQNGKPVEATQIVVSHQHLVESLTSEDVADLVRPYVKAALPEGWITPKTVWHINPTGKFFIGGPDGDCGLTGRKIIVDTYGGAAPHGGGAFSGKDPTKVDRSAAYAARYLAKNVVAAGLADRCTHPAFLRHWRGAAAVDLRRSAWNGAHRRGEARDGADGRHEPDSARHSRASQVEPADLRAHLGLWPFWPRAGGRRRLLLGKDRSRGHAARSRLTGDACRGLMTAVGGRDGLSAGCAGSTDAAAARRFAQGQERLLAEALPLFSIDAGSARRGACLLPARRAKCGSRSGSAPANISLSRRKPTRMSGFVGCEPFLNGVVAALAGLEREDLSNVRLRRGDAQAVIEAAPDGVLFARLHPLSGPLAKTAPPQAASRRLEHDRGAGAGHAQRRRAALRHRHRRLRRLDADALSRFARFPLDRNASRRLAPSLARLASDTL